MKPATALFNEVAQTYAEISDYTAFVSIKVDAASMSGDLFFKRASRLRIDFIEPSKQVIVSDGSILQIYIPKYDVTLKQRLDPNAKDPAGGAGLATPQGLNLLRKGYAIAYKIGPGTIPIDEGAKGGSAEPVYKLLLTWTNQSQGFRQIELSLSTGKVIRRIDGLTADRKKVRIDFSNIRFNTGIPDNKFDYDAPADSNVYDNFLFGTTN
jgi:outer membrane lipoprotein-sorting protein